jgi:hypothetical protein
MLLDEYLRSGQSKVASQERKKWVGPFGPTHRENRD